MGGQTINRIWHQTDLLLKIYRVVGSTEIEAEKGLTVE